MSFKNLASIALGAAALAISRVFWLEVCYYVSTEYPGLDYATCAAFDFFFFWAGVLAVVLGVIGLLRKS